MKKTAAIILGLTLACVGFSACDTSSSVENGDGSSIDGMTEGETASSADSLGNDEKEESTEGETASSADSLGNDEKEESTKGGLTQEQWNAAFEATFALENVSIVYDYVFPCEILGAGTMDIADGKVYYHWEDANSPYSCTGYIGKQGDTVYEWIKEGSSWVKTPRDAAITNYATARGTLRYFSYLDFEGYASWYENAEYDEATETFSFTATTRNEAYPTEVEVIICDEKIYSLAYEYTELASGNKSVYYEKYTFTDVGTTTVGDLPNV